MWLSYSQFELSIGSEKAVARARQVLQKGNTVLQEAQAPNEERLMLLENWLQLEVDRCRCNMNLIANTLQKEQGDAESVAAVEKEMPRRVKKRRPITTADGVEAGWQEYYDYIWPTDQGTTMLRLVFVQCSLPQRAPPVSNCSSWRRSGRRIRHPNRRAT